MVSNSGSIGGDTVQQIGKDLDFSKYKIFYHDLHVFSVISKGVKLKQIEV